MSLALLPLLLLLGAAAAKPPPPPSPPCPPSCTFNSAGPDKGCGEHMKLSNGSSVFECPKALRFSVGIDSNMVLQRDATTAVYGQMIGDGVGAKIEVTVTEAGGSSYTVHAVVLGDKGALPFAVRCWKPNRESCWVANYTASWKAFLKPAAAGGEYTISAKCTAGCTGDAARDVSSIERVTMGDVYFCGGQSNMQLPNFHSYSAKTLQKQMQGGQFAKLRFFQMIGGHQYEVVGKQGSNTAVWTRQDGVPTNYPYADGADGVLRQQTWWNASYGASWPARCKNPNNRKKYNETKDCPEIDYGPFIGFSATCTEFARNLLEELGDDAPPIGLIQSAIGGSMIEAWSPNATTESCQNKTEGGPTAAPTDGRLYYGMIAPFVNTTVAGWLWYREYNHAQ